jgi:hypothetical protein
VTRSKRRAIQWARRAADLGQAESCLQLAGSMYAGLPYAREVGHVSEAVGVATSAGAMPGHDIPQDILTDVVHWLQKGCADGQRTVSDGLEQHRREALVGAPYCRNDGCEVVGLLKDFKVCPQCKYARYCGAVCQKEDWVAGGHKASCGIC